MALFRKGPEIFGLDIGSSGVKAVYLKESGGSYTLASFGLAPLPPDAIADGTIKDPRTVVEAIRSAVSRAGLKGSSCAIAVCGRELIIKKVQIPEVPAREVGDVVQLEAEHHVPFAIDEVFLDYQSIGQHNGVLDLILVAVKKSKVLEYAAVVEDAGLTPTIVDVDSFALGNQFEVNNPGDRGETVALIDIGASIMKTNVVRGGSTIFARDIPFGGNNYTQAIAQQLKIPFEQAEAAKLGRDVGVRWETVVPALEAVSPLAGRRVKLQPPGFQHGVAVGGHLPRLAARRRRDLVDPDQHQSEPHRRHRPSADGPGGPESADRAGNQDQGARERAAQAGRRHRVDHQGSGAADPAGGGVRQRHPERSLDHRVRGARRATQGRRGGLLRHGGRGLHLRPPRL